MSTRLSDYHYELPAELIASRPPAERDSSRMMIVDRAAGTITHGWFRDFPGLLSDGDLVVLNDSRVIKARLISPGGGIEVFLLERVGPRIWKCLTKPGRKTRPGAVVMAGGTRLVVTEVLEGGERLVAFDEEPDLERYGTVPVPPYLKRDADAEDEGRYQTVYAKSDGSVAAPTAGLHFTGEILARIPHAFVTLHVGAGTFLPVKTEKVADHVMHEERYEISGEAAQAINKARRVVAVGTTVTRVLESQPPGPIGACAGRTSIFIHPPFEFRRVGALLTNFHLPGSTLLMLVSAFAGHDLIRRAYGSAVSERYRFFSYGDCMLIL